MPRPIIVVIIATIAIAKFSELARRPGLYTGSFFLARRFCLRSVFSSVNADRIY